MTTPTAGPAEAAPTTLVDDVVLRVRDLTVQYGRTPLPGQRRAPQPVRAVDRCSFELRRGECLGLIGESGSGKSTLGYALINLVPPPGRLTEGSIATPGVGELTRLAPGQWPRVRGVELGMVFQGAQSMFNPLMTIERQFVDILRAHGLDIKDGMAEARQLLRQARLDEARVLASYPHELSGGMRQRVAIISAVILRPKVLILDEPTTALDAVSQAKVLGILKEVRSQYALSMLLITHDFSVASNISDRIAVMYAGEIVETGPSRQLYHEPGHPYTQGLVAAVPSLSRTPGRRLALLTGHPPDLRHLPPGCRFAPRCRFATEACLGDRPALEATGDERRVVRCVRWREVRQAFEELDDEEATAEDAR